MSIEIKRSKKLVNYNAAIKYLEKRVNDVASGKKPELLWLLEHSPVFTAGVRSRENEILERTKKEKPTLLPWTCPPGQPRPGLMDSHWTYPNSDFSSNFACFGSKNDLLA